MRTHPWSSFLDCYKLEERFIHLEHSVPCPWGWRCLGSSPSTHSFLIPADCPHEQLLWEYRDGFGDCVTGRVARTGQQLLDSKLKRGSAHLAHLQCLHYPLSPAPLLFLVGQGHSAASCYSSRGAGGWFGKQLGGIWVHTLPVAGCRKFCPTPEHFIWLL